MSWLFDTCAISAILAPGAKECPDELLSIWTAAKEEGIHISSVTAYELRRGIRKLRMRGEGRRREVDLEKHLRAATILPLDDWRGGVWPAAADLFARGQQLRPSQLVGELDLLIAATAIANERTLVTFDTGLKDALVRLGHADRVRWVRHANADSGPSG